MEWMNRAARSTQPASQPGPGTNMNPNMPTQRSTSPSNKPGSGERFSIKHIPYALLLVSVTIVIVAVTALLMLMKDNSESRYVDEKKLQAVFLNGGQVYFGQIKDLNKQYISLSEIYYLRVNQQVQPKEGEQAQQDISLVKLGCELHGPQNHMVINRDQVMFWENLKDDGQVTKAVAEYLKANPNGQNCEQSQSAPQNNSGTDEKSDAGNSNQNNQQSTETQNP